MKEVLKLTEEFMRKGEEMGISFPEEGLVLDVHAAKSRGEWVMEPVEVNGFGAQMASGSGLFRWDWDWERMYGGGGVMEVRVVGAEESEAAKIAAVVEED